MWLVCIWKNSAISGRRRTGWIIQRYVKEGSQNLQEGMPLLTASSGMKQIVILFYHLLLIAHINIIWVICTVYFILIKSCLRNSACMEDGEKLISIFLSEVSRLVASDSAEQLVSGGGGRWIVLPLCPNVYICCSRLQKDTWKYKYTISYPSLPHDKC